MQYIRRRYAELYRWLNTECLEEIVLPEPDSLIQHRLLQTIERLPHPTVASKEEIKTHCSHMQYLFSEIVHNEDISRDVIPEEMIREKMDKLEEVTKMLEEIGNEEFESPLDKKLENIESLLRKLNDTTSTTQRRVGNVNERTEEMRALLSTTHDEVDNTLKGVCNDCGGDLRIYPHQSEDSAELRLGCRECDHEKYHVTSSFLIDEEKIPQVSVNGIGPTNAKWWEAEIAGEARTLRSMIFRYDGQEMVVMVLLIVMALILIHLASADSNVLWSLVGVALSLISLIFGPAVWKLIRSFQDPYENRYHEAAISVIDRVEGENKQILKQIAMQHLEKVEDSKQKRHLRNVR